MYTILIKALFIREGINLYAQSCAPPLTHWGRRKESNNPIVRQRIRTILQRYPSKEYLEN